jgi:hypothetical protein
MTHPVEAQWLVVLLCDSGARLLFDTRLELRQLPVGGGAFAHVDVTTVHIPTRSGGQMPTMTVFGVRCDAPTLAEAAALALSTVGGLACVAAFVANVAVETPFLAQAIEQRPGLTEREYGQWHDGNQWTDFTRPSRTLDGPEFLAVVGALLAAPEGERVMRALSQYDLAMRYWSVSARPLALAHLYMAAESLGDALQETHRLAGGMTPEQHAVHLGVNLTTKSGARNKGWKRAAEAAARTAYVFQSDDTTYDITVKASNGFEHGSQANSHLAAAAEQVAETVLRYVRDAVLELIALADFPMKKTIGDRTPTDRTPLLHFVGGKMTGPAGEVHDWAVNGEGLPRVQWDRIPTSIDRDAEGVLHVAVSENLAPQVAEGVTFLYSESAIWGGLNDAARFTFDISEPVITRGTEEASTVS